MTEPHQNGGRAAAQRARAAAKATALLVATLTEALEVARVRVPPADSTLPTAELVAGLESAIAALGVEMAPAADGAAVGPEVGDGGAEFADYGDDFWDEVQLGLNEPLPADGVDYEALPAELHERLRPPEPIGPPPPGLLPPPPHSEAAGRRRSASPQCEPERPASPTPRDGTASGVFDSAVARLSRPAPPRARGRARAPSRTRPSSDARAASSGAAPPAGIPSDLYASMSEEAQALSGSNVMRQHQHRVERGLPHAAQQIGTAWEAASWFWIRL